MAASEEEVRARREAMWKQWEAESLMAMTPFERYLYDTGQFDDVVREEILPTDEVVESGGHCDPDGCESCAGYFKKHGKVSYCLCGCHQNPKPRPSIPFNHCSYFGCTECPGRVTQGLVVSHCTCVHHKSIH